MKKVFMFAVLLISSVSMVFAAAFSPTVLKLSASQYVQYNFDSTTLEIPVTVTGTPAAVYFLVFTKDNGTTINRVRNGYLGWHYVNKIDTCLYLSPMSQFDRGTNKIKWNGNQFRRHPQFQVCRPCRNRTSDMLADPSRTQVFQSTFGSESIFSFISVCNTVQGAISCSRCLSVR